MHEYSDSQYKSTVLGLKGGLWVFRKSQKISTASDEYFLSYVKKNYRVLAFFKAENEQKALCSLFIRQKTSKRLLLDFYKAENEQMAFCSLFIRQKTSKRLFARF